MWGCNRRFKLQCFEEVEEKEEEEAAPGVEEILQKTVCFSVSETHPPLFFFPLIGHRLRLVKLFLGGVQSLQ